MKNLQKHPLATSHRVFIAKAQADGMNEVEILELLDAAASDKTRAAKAGPSALERKYMKKTDAKKPDEKHALAAAKSFGAAKGRKAQALQ